MYAQIPIFRLSQILFLQVSLLVTCVAPIHAAENKDVTWVLSESSNFIGNVTVNLSGNAISLYMEKLELEAFADDRKATVAIVNHRDKTFLEETRAQWKARANKYQAKSKKDHDIKAYKMVKGAKTKICGVATDFYEIKAIKLDGSLDNLTRKKQIWVSQDVLPGKMNSKDFLLEILKVFAQLDDIPDSLGVLLRLKTVKGGKLVSVLDTYKIEKSHKVISLKVPKGYRRVKDEVALLWGDDSDTSTDMFGSP